MKYFKHHNYIENGLIPVHASLRVPNLSMNIFPYLLQIENKKISFSRSLTYTSPEPHLPPPPLTGNCNPEFGTY